jgi:hypothetical protein
MRIFGNGGKKANTRPNNTRTNNIRNIKQQIQKLQYAVQNLRENVNAIKNRHTAKRIPKMTNNEFKAASFYRPGPLTAAAYRNRMRGS